MEQPIERARELLKTVRHASMATVNEDGTPHNTPYFFMYDKALKYLYWGSHPDSQHSKNIMRTGRIFVALYDGNVRGGLYFEAHDAHPTSGNEFKAGLVVHNQARARFGKNALTAEYYKNSPQKIYRADIGRMWVNYNERGADGLVIRDYRHEITAADLLA
jgi:hypothetical protein